MRMVDSAQEDAALGPDWSTTWMTFLNEPESSDEAIAEDEISDLLPPKKTKRKKK
jgi:hypothetical protein